MAQTLAWRLSSEMGRWLRTRVGVLVKGHVHWAASSPVEEGSPEPPLDAEGVAPRDRCLLRKVGHLGLHAQFHWVSIFIKYLL